MEGKEEEETDKILCVQNERRMKLRSVKTADELLGGSDENSQECETHLDTSGHIHHQRLKITFIVNKIGRLLLK